MYIHNIVDAYNILTAVSSSIILLLSFLLIKLRLPAVNEFQNFRKARRCLSVSYAILGFAALIICLSSSLHTSVITLFLTTASVASFQSLLFTVVHMLLMEPESINKTMLKKLFVLISAVNILVFAVYFTNVLPAVIVVSSALLLYLLLQGYFIIKFNNLCKSKRKFAEIYYADTNNKLQKTLIISFYASFIVGLLSLATSISGLPFFIAFIILYTLYYTHVVILLYNKFSPSMSLSSVFNVQKNDLSTKNISCMADSRNTEHSAVATDDETCKSELKLNLKRWVEEKGFAQCNLTVDEVAEHLGTDRNYLRKYFRDNVHTDFRTWRSELRIEEAKKLLIVYPHYSITQIGEMVGYNHRSNFFTQFTKIAGITPTDWRKQHGISNE